MLRLVLSIILGTIWGFISMAASFVMSVNGPYQDHTFWELAVFYLMFLPTLLYIISDYFLSSIGLGILIQTGPLILFPIFGVLTVYVILALLSKLNRSRFNKRIDLIK